MRGPFTEHTTHNTTAVFNFPDYPLSINLHFHSLLEINSTTQTKKRTPQARMSTTNTDHAVEKVDVATTDATEADETIHQMTQLLQRIESLNNSHHSSKVPKTDTKTLATMNDDAAAVTTNVLGADAAATSDQKDENVAATTRQQQGVNALLRESLLTRMRTSLIQSPMLNIFKLNDGYFDRDYGEDEVSEAYQIHLYLIHHFFKFYFPYSPYHGHGSDDDDDDAGSESDGDDEDNESNNNNNNNNNDANDDDDDENEENIDRGQNDDDSDEDEQEHPEDDDVDANDKQQPVNPLDMPKGTSWHYDLFHEQYEFQTFFLSSCLGQVLVQTEYMRPYVRYLIAVFGMSDDSNEKRVLKAMALLHFTSHTLRLEDAAQDKYDPNRGTMFDSDYENEEQETEAQRKLDEAQDVVTSMLPQVFDVVFDKCLVWTENTNAELDLPIMKDSYTIRTSAMTVIDTVRDLPAECDIMLEWARPAIESMMNERERSAMGELELERALSLVSSIAFELIPTEYGNPWVPIAELMSRSTLSDTCKRICCEIAYRNSLISATIFNEHARPMFQRLCDYCLDPSPKVAEEALISLNNLIDRYGPPQFRQQRPALFDRVRSLILPVFQRAKDLLNGLNGIDSVLREGFTLLNHIAHALLSTNDHEALEEYVKWIDETYANYFSTFLSNEQIVNIIYTCVASLCDMYKRPKELQVITVMIDQCMQRLVESEMVSLDRSKDTYKQQMQQLESYLDFLGSAFECHPKYRERIAHHPQYNLRTILHQSVLIEELRQVSFVLIGAAHRHNMAHALLHTGETMVGYAIRTLRLAAQILALRDLNPANNNILWSLAMMLRLLDLSTEERRALLRPFDWTELSYDLDKCFRVAHQREEGHIFVTTLLFLYLELCHIEDGAYNDGGGGDGPMRRMFGVSFHAMDVYPYLDDSEERSRILKHIIRLIRQDNSRARQLYLLERTTWNHSIRSHIRDLNDELQYSCELVASDFRFIQSLGD